MPAITDLPELVATLAPADAARAARLLHIDRVQGRCVIPESMREWVQRQMGDLAAVETQTVVRVVNQVTWEGALYNPLRNKRPLAMGRADNNVIAPGEFDIFADPERSTAADVFGRVRGAHCVTTGNVSRWDGQCAVLIFDEPDPLSFTRAHFRDYFATALRWARAAHETDVEARYFVWMWNGGIKAGASIKHAHAQMGLGRRMHYARIEMLRRAAQAYAAQHGADYFADMQALHDALGLGFRAGALRGFVNVAAARAKDTFIIGDAIDDALADAFHDVLRALIDHGGTGAFNAVIYAPPLFGPHDDWRDFPVMVRIVDRGSPAMLSSDIGALDVFAHNTIAADPFAVREVLRGR